MTHEEVNALENGLVLDIFGHKISHEDVLITCTFNFDSESDGMSANSFKLRINDNMGLFLLICWWCRKL